MDDGSIRILVVGSLPPPVGGATVSLQHLIEFLEKRPDVSLSIVNTGGVRGRGWSAPWHYVRTVARICRMARGVDVVSLHAAPSGLYLIGPIVWAAARMGRKPLVVRKFGGIDYAEFRGIARCLARFVVHHCDVYLAQSRALAEAAQRDGVRDVQWYPTSRPMEPLPELWGKESKPTRRLVFASQIKLSKGIREAIDATEQLDGLVSLDVYGPFFEGLNESLFAGCRHVRYRGVVSGGKMIETLRGYDALVFPTYYPGEGYPGILFEALSAGIPAITTHWSMIPEFMDETCAIIIAPKDVNQLADAMRTLAQEPARGAALRQGMLAKRSFFDSERWVSYFVDVCLSLAKRDPSKSACKKVPTGAGRGD